MKRSALIHPFLFTFTSVLFLYIRVSSTIAPPEILRPLFWLCLLLALLIFPVHKITKNWYKTGFVLTFFVFTFFYEKTIFLLVFFTVAFILAVWFFYTKKIRRRKMSLKDTTFLLNMLGFALVFGGGIKLIALLSQVPNSYYQEYIFTNLRTPIAELTPRENNPDIYYIILDGYARTDVLSDFYDFDNTAFIRYLEEKGFVVPTENHSNYPKTTFSVASTLNMDYIQNIAPGLDETYFWWLMSPLIDYSQTRIMLEAIGYESVSLGVDWTITDNQTTDIYYSPSPIKISEFENYFLFNTALVFIRPLLDKIAYVPSSYDAHRELILSNFDTLTKIPYLEGEHFTFVHFLSPHPPFVFDENGNEIDPNIVFSLNDDDDYNSIEQSRESYRQGYRGQVPFINKKLMVLIDDILASSETPPIIILQADHGSGMFVDFSSAKNTCLHERFSPFAAYYLPDIDHNPIPSDITPVNLFRIVFNEYFDADLPLLNNAYYFSKDPFYLYQMEEISTQRINSPCNMQP
jgi:hypothetical protein